MENGTFYNYISGLKDERLIEILNIEYREYTDEALRIVRDELYSRGFKNVSLDNKSELLTLRDLILQVRFEDVQRILKKEFHISKDISDRYNSVFHQLLSITAVQLDNISIVVDKHYDEYTNTFSEWDVYGTEVGKEERFTVDLYNWNDWMSFNVKAENIDHVGKDLFIVCCLLKMTTYGFTSEEIESKFNEITSKSDVVSYDIYPTDNNDEDAHEVHPWIRFWARTIDVMIFSTILNNILAVASIKVWQLINGIEYIMPTSLILWVLIESILLSTWGTTPGKLMFGITVREVDGSILNFTRALNRSASVWFFGMGCGISIIELITKITSYNRLSKKGITRWDQNGKYSISHTEISTINIIIAIIVLIGIPTLRYSKVI
jgi:uncharacterized RDD family membrane protein YckC